MKRVFMAVSAVLLLLPAVDLAVRGVFLVIMAMPAPAVSSIAAEQYGGDRELAARTVFFTSLLCVISIPLAEQYFYYRCNM